MAPPKKLVGIGVVVAGIALSSVTASADRGDGGDRRPPRPRPRPEAPLVFEARTLDGTGNNVAHPSWGSADTLYRRVAAARYADGRGEMVDGPDARYISNRIFNDTAQNVFSARGMTQWVWTWGQLLDHTFGLRVAGDEDAPIAYDAGDPLEAFRNDLGDIAFERTAPAPGTGDDDARQQVNTVDSFIDASSIYGNDAERLAWLRDGAKLRLPDGYLPRADSAEDAPEMELMGRLMGDPDGAVVAGDVRANENIALTAAHTLFAREHNRIVDLLPTSLTDDQRFEIARRVVGAELQWITYHDWLPALGVRLPEYRGYKANVDPSLSDEFATVGYRAHSMIHGEMEFETDDEERVVPLNEAFGNPGLLVELGLGTVSAGLAGERQYANDEQIDNQLRSVMFQIPGPQSADPMACLDGPTLPDCFTGVVDLAAIDIERGRDHGMPSYNDLRRAYGLAPKTSFTAITGEATETLPAGMTIDDPRILEVTALYDGAGNRVAPGTDAAAEDVVRAIRRSTVAARLKAIYGTVDAVDAFVGMSAERHVNGTEMGELELAMWTEQFTRLRDGDRFYFANDPVLRDIERRYGIDFRLSLRDVILRNTDADAEDLPADVFRLASAAPAPQTRASRSR